MPVHNITYAVRDEDGNRTPGPHALFERGPLIQIEVSLASDLAEQLQQEGEEIPAPAAGFALIDTGATTTAIDQTIVEQLDLQPIGTTQIGTAGGPQETGVYTGQISFPGAGIGDIESQQLIGVDLSGQLIRGIVGHGGDAPEDVNLIALIGRDILAKTIMVYNGPSGTLTIGI